MADENDGINFDDFVMTNDFTEVIDTGTKSDEDTAREAEEAAAAKAAEEAAGQETKEEKIAREEEEEIEAARIEAEENETEEEKATRLEEEEEAAKALENETEDEKAVRLASEEDNQDEGGDAPFLDIIEVIHEHNDFDFDAKDFEGKNTVEGLMDFVNEVITSNSKPEFASEEVSKFNEYVDKYGAEKASEYLEVNFGETNWEEVDLEKPENQKALYKSYLDDTTRFSDAKKEKMIKSAEDLGELEDDIEEWKTHMKEASETKKKAFDDNAEAERKAEYDNYQEYLQTQKKRIEDSSEIAGFELSKKDKEGLYDFAYKVDKNGKTKYQLLRESDKDLNLKLLMLAYKGVDKNKLTKQSDSAATKRLKAGLSKFTDKKSTSKGSGAKTPKKVNPSSETDYNDFVFKK